MATRKQAYSVMMHEDVADWYRKLGDTVLSKGLAIAHRILTDPHLFDAEGLTLAARRFKPEEPMIPGLRALLLPDVFETHEPEAPLTPAQCTAVKRIVREMVEGLHREELPSELPRPRAPIEPYPPADLDAPQPVGPFTEPSF